MQPGVRTEFQLQSPLLPLAGERLQFAGDPIPVEANAALSGFGPAAAAIKSLKETDSCSRQSLPVDEIQTAETLALNSLKPLGQIRDSFILAVNSDGLWIIDQHVAHERILFEKVLKERSSGPLGEGVIAYFKCSARTAASFCRAGLGFPWPSTSPQCGNW